MSEKEMLSGAVIWFDSVKGYGFIKQDTDEEDIFVHWSNINVEGFKTVKPDQRVTYELGKNHMGIQSINVELVGEPPELLEE